MEKHGDAVRHSVLKLCLTDSEESDDILSYLQGLHDTPEACVFDIAVHNFLYNAGVEFESLQW